MMKEIHAYGNLSLKSMICRLEEDDCIEIMRVMHREFRQLSSVSRDGCKTYNLGTETIIEYNTDDFGLSVC